MARRTPLYKVNDTVLFVVGEPKGNRGIVKRVDYDGTGEPLYSVVWDNGRTTSQVRSEELEDG